MLAVIATRADRQVTLAPDKAASRLIQSKFNVCSPRCLFFEIVRAALIRAEKLAGGQHGLLFLTERTIIHRNSVRLAACNYIFKSNKKSAKGREMRMTAT